MRNQDEDKKDDEVSREKGARRDPLLLRAVQSPSDKSVQPGKPQEENARPDRDHLHLLRVQMFREESGSIAREEETQS